MGKLVGISMAGIDMRTPVEELERLQAMDPRAEFGIILSKNWSENGNRYYDPDKLEKFRGRNLNLCAHLCGSVARAAIQNDWRPASDLVDLSLFDRVQLNIAGYAATNPKTLAIDVPDPVKEVIIQQKAAYDCGMYYRWFLEHKDNRAVSVLIDGSGGMGKDSEIIPLANIPKVGYAGGMGPDNIYGKTTRLLLEPSVYEFWVDMESKVRTDEWFDIVKAETVIREVQKAESAISTQKFGY